MSTRFRTMSFGTGLAAAALAWALGVAGCGGAPAATPAAPGGSVDEAKWPADDQSLCNRFVHWRHNPALEVSETAGPGSLRPNIRRVYKSVGERDSRHTVLLCREVDTNLDGIKDVVRTFNEKGEPLHEEADTNYDSKIDVWLNFTGGRVEEEDADTTYTAGRPNVWKFYVDGQLSRVRRNTHCAGGQADTWEIYYKNRLERVGSDTTCDGHVDRWDRDAQLLAAEDAAQEKAAAASSANPDDGGAASPPMTVGTAGEIVDGGPAAPPKPKKATRAPR
jgi:hypothetical protein